jgi:hypothetical protein
VVCLEHPSSIAVGPCDHHQLCAMCCLRLRLCYHDNRCPLCKTEAKQVRGQCGRLRLGRVSCDCMSVAALP